MAYLLSSVKEASSMSNRALKEALKPYVLYGLTGASRDELIGMWLERFGVTELDQPLLASEVDKAIDEWERELA